jgi:hypothetical protein
MSGRHLRTRRIGSLIRLAAIPLVFMLGSGAAWAYWTAGSYQGGGGASIAASVNQGATPSASAASTTVTVTWAASTLTNGSAVSGYQLKRYNAAGTTAQSMSNCTGTITSTSCTETSVPEGSWTYKITPLFLTNWKGAESLASTVVAVDGTPPTGGSVTISNLAGTDGVYSRSATLSLTLGAFADTNGFSAQLWRATATLTSTGVANGTCGALTAYSKIGLINPSSPTTNVAPDPSCVSYQYVATDPSGNTTTRTSATAKIDTTAPTTPVFTNFAASAATNTWWNGSTLFYRSNVATGSFTATATSSDTASGIASYAFTLPTPTQTQTWTSTGGATSGVNTYSWSGRADGTGASVTATNHAGGQSQSTAFTMAADETPPTGASVTPPSGTSSKTTASVAFTTGTDAGSGIGTRLLQRASVAQASGACPATGYSTFTTIFTDPTSSPVSDTVSVGTCYKYQYVVSDNVGNTVTASSANVLRVMTYAAEITATTSLTNWWRLGDTTSSLLDSKSSAPGTYTNSPTYGQTGALNGDTNTAVQFGNSSWAEATTSPLTPNFSAELWFKSPTITATCSSWNSVPSMVQAIDGKKVFDFGISLCGGKVIAGTDVKGNGFATSISSGAGYADGFWHHAVFTRSASGVINLYVDGTVVSGSGVTGDSNTPTTTKLSIAGTSTSANNFVGTLDEIALYNVVLSATEVKTHYDAR